MSNRHLNAIIQYEENCDYNSSVSYQSISVPLQDVNIITRVENSTSYNDYDQDILASINTSQGVPLFLNEDLKITAIIKHDKNIVTAGKIIFYYKQNDDPSGEWKQINSEPIEVNNDGEASVIYMPNGSGYIKTEYIGDAFYNDKTTEDTKVELDTIPTKITFIPPKENYPPHFVKPEDTITMSVYVGDIKKNPVKHGIVTFLHYFTHGVNNADAGVEKVIGNPVYLENGIGTITYSPMQLYSIEEYAKNDENIFKNLELIEAVYNYNKTEYGVNWHYYKSHSDYTSISILRSSSISITIKKIVNNEMESPTIQPGGLYTVKDNESFYLIATVTNDDNEKIEIIENDVVFIINNEEYSTEYNENTKEFECIISNLPEGNYEIYAHIKEKGITISDDMEIPIENNGIQIEDKLYLDSANSDNLYLEVTPSIINCNLTLTADPIYYTIDNQGYANNNLKVVFDVDPTNIDLFVGQKCSFQVSPNNITYEGTIQYENNELFAQPDDNIPMTEVNNYTIRAYIPNITYTYNGVTKVLPTIFSNNITIKARNNMNISFGTNKTINNYYPGSIKFTLKAENIYSDILNVHVFLDNNETEYEEYQLTKTNNLIQCNIDNIDIGTHTLHAKVVNEDIFVQQPEPYSFEIQKNILETEMYTTSVYAAIEQSIAIGIKTTNNAIININNNNLNITLKNPNEENVACTWSVNRDLTSDYLLYLTINAPIQQKGVWKLLINYTEDNYYVMPTEIFEFNAANTKPLLDLKFDLENNLIGQITHDGNYNNNQLLNLLLKFNYENNNSKNINITTDLDGNFSVLKNNIVFNNTDEWQNWKSIQVIFDLENNPNSIGYNSYDETIVRQMIGVKDEYTELIEW